MAEYIDRKQIKYRKERVLNSWAGSKHTDCDVSYKTIVEKYDINNIPTADVIERSKIDKAIKALEQQSDDCVSRAEVHKMLENIPITDYDKWFNWLQKACLRLAYMPPVTPTHGTCKDCKHFHNVRKGFNICDLWTIACADNHYCADYEKRGNENG